MIATAVTIIDGRRRDSLSGKRSEMAAKKNDDEEEESGRWYARQNLRRKEGPLQTNNSLLSHTMLRVFVAMLLRLWVTLRTTHEISVKYCLTLAKYWSVI